MCEGEVVPVTQVITEREPELRLPGRSQNPWARSSWRNRLWRERKRENVRGFNPDSPNYVEKYLPPSSCLAFLSHLNIEEHQTDVGIRYRQPKLISFIKAKKDVPVELFEGARPIASSVKE